MRTLLFLLLIGFATLIVGGITLFQIVKTKVSDQTKPVAAWSPARVSEDPEKFAATAMVEMVSLVQKISDARAALRVEVSRSRSVLRFEEGFQKLTNRRFAEIKRLLSDADRIDRWPVSFEGQTYSRRDLILFAGRLENGLLVSNEKVVAARRILELAPTYEADLEMVGTRADEALIHLSAVGDGASVRRIPAFSKAAFETIQKVSHLASAAESRIPQEAGPSVGELLFQELDQSMTGNYNP